MRAWLKLFLPLAALVCGLFYFSSRSESRHRLAALEARQQTQLRLAGDRLAEVLAASATDLRVIADTPAMMRFLQGEADGSRSLESLLSAFIRNDRGYHQLGVIDPQGREQLRVSRAAEGPQITPPAELQDLKGRDYLTETLSMQPGEVRVSRFELNVENGQVELPRRPLVRLSARVSAEGTGDHILVASLRGTVLLKAVGDLLDDPDAQTWLLDHEGYWVLHADPSRTWGHQLDRSQRVQTLLPELAQRLGSSPGSVRIGDALYVHRRLDVGVQVAGTDRAMRVPTLDLVSRIPATALPGSLAVDRLLLLAAVLLLGAIGSALLARNRLRADRAEQRAVQLLREEAAAGGSRAWIREHSYQLSLKAHAARGPTEFAELVLAELATGLPLTAGCLYAADQGRAAGLAACGLAPGRKLRDFQSGEGLVGQALHSREERRLRPPPTGYLDMEAGLGASVAADLLILPLWVHGRTVGVVELAFSRDLLPREEEFLRSILPLLALNLDGFLGRAHA